MGNPAYQSMLHPVSRQCGSRTSRRYAGPHTWAPMSPPVGVLLRKMRLGCMVANTMRVAPSTMAVVTMDLSVSESSESVASVDGDSSIVTPSIPSSFAWGFPVGTAAVT